MLRQAILTTIINFEFDSDQSSLDSAVRKAINKTFAPDLRPDAENNIRVTTVRVYDSEYPRLHRHWGEP